MGPITRAYLMLHHSSRSFEGLSKRFMDWSPRIAGALMHLAKEATDAAEGIKELADKESEEGDE